MIALLASSFVQPAQASGIPVLDKSCNLGPLVTTPASVTYTPYGLAVTDTGADAVVFVSDNCATTRAGWSTSAFGSVSPRGIGWDSAMNRFVIADDSTDELYFVSVDGVQLGNCDLNALGITDVTGVTVMADGNLAVVDVVDDEVYLLDTLQQLGGTCNQFGNFDTAAMPASNAEDIVWQDDVGKLGVLDRTTNEVYLVDQSGASFDQFDTAGPTATAPLYGLTYVPSIERYFMLSNNKSLYQLDVRGSQTPVCSTAPWGSVTPTGIGKNAITEQLLLTDNTTDLMYVIDQDTCTVARQFFVGTYGSTSPSDATYLSLTNEYVVADNVTNNLYFFDATTGAATSTCDLKQLGIYQPTGVDYLPELDLLAVSSTGGDQYALLDPTCAPIHTRSGSGLNVNDVTLTGVTYLAEWGLFLMTDSANDEVWVKNFEGTTVLQYDTGGLALTSPVGLVMSPLDPTAFYVVDDVADSIVLASVPALGDASSLSGRFKSASATVYLWDRGQGAITGTAILGASTLPVFGEFNGTSGSLAIGAVTPTGSVVSFPINVSADLNTINAPLPVGTLTRQ